jgi:hypothetical protein
VYTQSIRPIVRRPHDVVRCRCTPDICMICGQRKPTGLRLSPFGFRAHADQNAAINILRRNTPSMRMKEPRRRSNEVRTGRRFAPPGKSPALRPGTLLSVLSIRTRSSSMRRRAGQFVARPFQGVGLPRNVLATLLPGKQRGSREAGIAEANGRTPPAVGFRRYAMRTP